MQLRSPLTEQLLPGDVGHVASFANEFNKRRLVVKTGNANHVIDIVAVESAGRGENKIIMFSLLKVRAGKDRRIGAADVRFRNEFVKVLVDGEDSG